VISRIKNPLVFPGVWTHLTSAAVGPCATGTLSDTVGPQIATIHPGNTDRIFDSE